MNWRAGSDTSTGTALLLGGGLGLGVVVLYLASGLVAAGWSVTDFSTNLTLETVGTGLLLAALTVVTFAIPVAAYLRFHLLAPVVVLAVVLLGWFGYAAATGVLTSDDVFGVGLYVVGLSPLYVVCYALGGTVEYYVRRRIAA